MEAKVEEQLNPRDYRVSVQDAVFYARFDTGTPFQLNRVKKTVEKAGLKYGKSTELVARGHLVEADGELLLVDEDSQMRLRLAPANDGDTFVELKHHAGMDHPTQIRGTVDESEPAREADKSIGADFTVTVTSFVTDPAEFRIPPVYPEESTGEEAEDDGWF